MLGQPSSTLGPITILIPKVRRLGVAECQGYTTRCSTNGRGIRIEGMRYWPRLRKGRLGSVEHKMTPCSSCQFLGPYWLSVMSYGTYWETTCRSIALQQGPLNLENSGRSKREQSHTRWLISRSLTFLGTMIYRLWGASLYLSRQLDCS